MIPSRRAFYAAVGLQLAVILFMVGNRLRVRWTGTVVRLQTVPVDPRSLMRGDYVILSYPLSTLRVPDVAEGDSHPGDPAEGLLPVTAAPKLYADHRVYVKLEVDPTTKLARAVAVSGEPYPGGLFLRGRIRSAYSSASRGRDLRVRYGIESWFVPEGTGKAIEKLRNERKVVVQVAVAPSGEAILKELELGASE